MAGRPHAHFAVLIPDLELCSCLADDVISTSYCEHVSGNVSELGPIPGYFVDGYYIYPIPGYVLMAVHFVPNLGKVSRSVPNVPNT